MDTENTIVLGRDHLAPLHMPVKPDVCIYHHNCADGYTAAWVVACAVPDVELIAGVHGEPPPLERCQGRNVIIVDFSYKEEQMRELIAVAQHVTVLDHHASAVKELRPLWLDDALREKLKVRFDMEKSGAMIAWEYIYSDADPGKLIRFVQDRDLWKFELPGSREISAYIFSTPYTMEEWTELGIALETDEEAVRKLGAAILKKQRKDIAEFTQASLRWITICGHRVPVINAPYMWGSDACHELCKKYPEARFAAYYWDGPEFRTWGLRSSEEGEDVSKIAQRFGGGGHVHASGFRTALLASAVDGGMDLLEVHETYVQHFR